MTVAATNKCNITGYVLDQLNQLKYGVECSDSSSAIVENYIAYLNCPDVDLEICHPDDCKNEVVRFSCLINVPVLSGVINSNTITYTASIVGGKAPFTYAWSFDQTKFTASGATNQPELSITAKPGLDISTLVASVTLVVTDADGCKDTKTCYLDNSLTKCNPNFVPCVNPSGLSVRNSVTYCLAPSNLRVSKNS